jgi:hypothetical protein
LKPPPNGVYAAECRQFPIEESLVRKSILGFVTRGATAGATKDW